MYLAVKFLAGHGQIRKEDLDISAIARLSGYRSLSSIYSHFKVALEKNWIGEDDEWYFIRGFDRLRADYSAKGRTAAQVRPEDVERLDEFLLGAKVKSVRARKRFLLKSASKVPKTKAEPYANLHAPKPYLPEYISCSLIGEWFGFSAPTASRLKQRAKKSGYLDYKHRLNKLRVPISQIDKVKKTVAPASRLTTYRWKGHFYIAIRLTDEFCFGDKEHRYYFKSRCSM